MGQGRLLHERRRLGPPRRRKFESRGPRSKLRKSSWMMMKTGSALTKSAKKLKSLESAVFHSRPRVAKWIAIKLTLMTTTTCSPPSRFLANWARHRKRAAVARTQRGQEAAKRWTLRRETREHPIEEMSIHLPGLKTLYSLVVSTRSTLSSPNSLPMVSPLLSKNRS